VSGKKLSSKNVVNTQSTPLTERHKVAKAQRIKTRHKEKCSAIKLCASVP